MRISRRVLLGVVAVAVVASGYLGYTRVFASKPPESTAQPVQVSRGNLRLMVTTSGTVKPPRAADLSFRSSGVVEKVHVQTGDSVEKGQPLAQLETPPLELQLAQAKIALRSAELNLEILLEGSRAEDIASARAGVVSVYQKLATMVAQGKPDDVASAAANLQSMRAKLDRLKSPRAADVTAAHASVESARARLQDAQSNLEELRSPTQSDVDAAQSRVTSRRASLTSAVADLDELRDPDPADSTAAQAAVDAARVSLQNAQEDLDDLIDPPLKDVAEAEADVKTAENNLAKKRTAQWQLRADLNEEKLANLVDAYTELFLAREKLAEDEARSASAEQMEADERAVLLALRRLAMAENDADRIEAGVTAQEYRSAQIAIEEAQIALDEARRDIEELLSPPATDVARAESAVTTARANLESAQARLKKLENPDAADIAAAESTMESARSALQEAKTDLERLLDPKPSDIATAESTVTTAQANLQRAEAELEELLDPSADVLAAAESSVFSAQVRLENTRTPYTKADLASQRASVQQAEAQLSKVVDPSTSQDLARAQLSVDRARLEVEQARFTLDHAVLAAPFDGIVSNVSVTEGTSQGVGASTVVMSVIDPSVMQAELSVDETDVGKLELAQEALITVEAIGRRPYRGKVIAIAPTATTQSGVTIYRVTLSIENPRRLKAGMTAVANVVYEERQNVLLVPSRAVKRANRVYTVQVLVNGAPETRTVTVGSSDDRQIEVTEGLQEGEEVLVEGFSRGGTPGRIPGQGRLGGGDFGGGGGRR